MKQIHNVKLGHIRICQVCGNNKLLKVLNLGKQPPCDSILEQKNQKEEKFPLNFVFCEKCFLGQIDYAVPPKTLFYKKYPYRSGITKTLVDKLFSTSETVRKKIKIPKNALCVDIGSNDGTLLKGFKRFGFNVLGVEPTDISMIANKEGIKTLQTFFNEDTSRKISNLYGKAFIITATNVFAHTPNLFSIIQGIKTLLKKDGVFVSESHYLINLLNTLQYDSIYHEHLKYYSLKSLQELFKFYDLEIFDIEFIDNYGGSIRVYTAKTNRYSIKSSVKNCIKNEENFFKNPYKVFKQFSEKTKNNKETVLEIIKKYKKENKKVIGIGCPGRCSTFLNYCKINNKMMSYIAEQESSLKIQKFLPGMRIPIIDEKEMFENPPDLAIMLSWHYAKDIISILRKKGFKSKILVPLPKPKFY